MNSTSKPITVDNFTDLWDYSNPAQTEKRFRELLPEAQKDHRYHIELLTQLARTYGLRREFDQANALLNEAEELLNSYPLQGSLRPQIRYLLERGRAFNSSGKPELSRPLFIKAWEIGQGAKEDRLAVDAAHMMGIIEPPEEGLRWNLEAIAYAEQSTDRSAQVWLGALYNNIGVSFLEQEDYENALKYYQKGLEWRLKQGSSGKTIRIARWCVARAMRGLGQLEEALAEQRELERLAEEQGEKSGYVFEEIAECLLALGRSDKASSYFGMAYEELSKDTYLAKHEPERLERLRSHRKGESMERTATDLMTGK